MPKVTRATFEKTMRTLTVPEGFVARFGTDHRWGHDAFAFILEKPDDTQIVFTFEGESGHTYFKAGKDDWRCFDRLGVSDSFYWGDWSGKIRPVADLNNEMIDQIANVARSREYLKTAITVPVIGFTVSPARLEMIKADLKKDRPVIFTPSGFGTGYTITRKKHAHYAERAKSELEKSFGFEPLFITRMDCD